MPRTPLLLLTFLGLSHTVLGQQPAAPVECVVLNEENWDEFAPDGKEVDAIYGDVVLRNQHLTAVIAQPLATRHANMTVRDVGGALIDLTSRDFESDQLSAFYPGAKAYPFRQWESINSDGEAASVSDAVVRAPQIGIRVTADGSERRPEVSVTYLLSSDEPLLTITTTFRNRTDRNLQVQLTDSLRADGGKEDMAKSPNGTAEIFWFDDRYWQQAYGIIAENRRIQSNSTSRESTLKYVDSEGATNFELPPGEAIELTRTITAGRTLLHVQSHLGSGETTPVEFAVLDKAGRPLQNARLEIRRSGILLGTSRVDDNGQTTISVPPASYSVGVSVNGHTLEDNVPVGVEAGDTEKTIQLASYHPGTLVAKIVDENGTGIPCKVELSPRGETLKPDFGPETAEYAVRNLRYAPHGEFSQDLHPGTYDIIISHGPEYDAIFTEVTVEPGKSAELTGTLVRSVNTTGWISSDYHSHSSPSGDNTSSQLGRVLNLVCEHIEFAPCTEHNRIDTYVPHIKALGVGRFIGTCTGMELTGQPLPLNHQNAFPLHHHPHEQDGGAPVTDVSPEKQIERIALWDDRSEKLIQQNHPDIGWLFYDKNGDGEPDEGHSRSFGLIDVMEIHPIDAMIRRKPFTQAGDNQRNNRMFNWLQLLNQGHRIPGVVNTDAHYNFHGSGWLRNWIESPTDDPAQVKTLDIVHASEHGHLVMSNGPFLEVSAQSSSSNDAFTAGDDMTSGDGKVDLQIKVQCPNWHDINRVFVLVNGELRPELNFRRETHSDRFGDEVVKFEGTVPVTLDGDAHLIVVAAGEGLKLGPVMGPDRGEQEPTAVTNPIFVDVDGGGFTPNQDTLGQQLPVRRD